MPKKKKQKTVIGIEYDAFGIRAAAVEHRSAEERIPFYVQQVEELHGDYSKDENLGAGLAEIRKRMGGSPAVSVATCISGKQVYTVQMPFRKLKPEETRKALRLEIRKSLPFDAATAAIEYQVLSENAEEQQLLVTAVANSLLGRQLGLMEKAGLEPQIVDTLPTCVANAFFSCIRYCPNEDLANVVLHFGSTVGTLVIVGRQAPFFHRNLYFSAEELYGLSGTQPPPSEQERKRRVGSLADEIMRTVAYYQKSFGAGSAPALHLLGSFTDETELTGMIAERTGLSVEVVDGMEDLDGAPADRVAPFACALALAMRDD